MEMHLKVSSGSEPLKKAIGAAKRQSRHPKISNFSACNTTNTKLGFRFSNMKTNKMLVCVCVCMRACVQKGGGSLTSVHFGGEYAVAWGGIITENKCCVFRTTLQRTSSGTLHDMNTVVKTCLCMLVLINCDRKFWIYVHISYYIGLVMILSSSHLIRFMQFEYSHYETSPEIYSLEEKVIYLL